MLIDRTNPRTAVLLLMIAAIGAVRVIFNFSHDISPLANFSPLGAMALFGGSYFNRGWKAFGFPLLTLFVSDFILQQTVFRAYGDGFLYEGWYWVYGAFALMTLAGRLMLRRPTVSSFLAATLVTVLIHWIVTDLSVWIGSSRFSQDLAGFLHCLTEAIPYELRFLTGTLIYGSILFGAFEWMKRKYPSLAKA
ncbi:MAG TPA: DUF6580 family putative transport protein [Flavisolibacter sp.]|nr:DUF6580 family putative transport protein [Flavisolibacter sp.]